jgi:hypothetical protein
MEVLVESGAENIGANFGRLVNLAMQIVRETKAGILAEPQIHDLASATA